MPYGLATTLTFWGISERLLMQRPHPWLLNKSLGEIFTHFKNVPMKPRTAVAKVLSRGSFVLLLASIVCLFTITTW